MVRCSRNSRIVKPSRSAGLRRREKATGVRCTGAHGCGLKGASDTHAVSSRRVSGSVFQWIIERRKRDRGEGGERKKIQERERKTESAHRLSDGNTIDIRGGRVADAPWRRKCRRRSRGWYRRWCRRKSPCPRIRASIGDAGRTRFSLGGHVRGSPRGRRRGYDAAPHVSGWWVCASCGASWSRSSRNAHGSTCPSGIPLFPYQVRIRYVLSFYIPNLRDILFFLLREISVNLVKWSICKVLLRTFHRIHLIIYRTTPNSSSLLAFEFTNYLKSKNNKICPFGSYDMTFLLHKKERKS